MADRNINQLTPADAAALIAQWQAQKQAVQKQSAQGFAAQVAGPWPATSPPPKSSDDKWALISERDFERNELVVSLQTKQGLTVKDIYALVDTLLDIAAKERDRLIK